MYGIRYWRPCTAILCGFTVASVWGFTALVLFHKKSKNAKVFYNILEHTNYNKINDAEFKKSGRKNSFRIIHNTRKTKRKYTVHYNEEDKTSEIL